MCVSEVIAWANRVYSIVQQNDEILAIDFKQNTAHKMSWRETPIFNDVTQTTKHRKAQFQYK